MLTVTLPKSLIAKGDMVILSRRDYERFILAERKTKSKNVYVPTVAERAMIARARKDFAAGKYREI